MSPVVVITGASAGVGRATAVRFGQEGYDVGLIARGRAGLEGARRDVEATGRRALVLPLDVADADAVMEAAHRVGRELGPSDVWVNNAMTALLGEVRHTTAEEFRRVTEVTYLGSVHAYLAALAVMRPRDRGTIVQVGSALAWRGIPLQATYCAAKHAIHKASRTSRSSTPRGPSTKPSTPRHPEIRARWSRRGAADASSLDLSGRSPVAWLSGPRR